MNTYGPFFLLLIIGVVIAFFTEGYRDGLGGFILQSVMWAVGLGVGWLTLMFVLSLFSGGDGGGGGGEDVFCTNLGCEP